MVLASISKILQEVKDFKALEQLVWKVVAERAREEMKVLLEAIDEHLMRHRPPGLRHCGLKRRVVETLFGPVEIARRRYIEVLPTGERRWRYLLDEALGLPPEVRVSPGVQDRAVQLALAVPYREAARRLKETSPDGKGPSHGTIHRWACALGGRRLEVEEAKVRELFEEGVIPEGSGERVDVLFAEADEVRVALQGPKRGRKPQEQLPSRRGKRGEVRILLCHRGWQRRDPGSSEYRLEGKHVYAAVAEAEKFWQGAILQLMGYCQLEHVRCTVLNGDGAAWIRQGMEYLPNCTFQLDRWHLHRAIRSALGWDPPSQQRLMDLLASGVSWEALDTFLLGALRAAPDQEKRQAVRRLRTYLLENRDGLVDYRRRVLGVERQEAWRGLGAAESNVDKPWANRLTKRGMSWGRGLRGFVRLLSLQINGTLDAWLDHCREWKPVQPQLREAAVRLSRAIADSGEDAWLQARMPALAGPTRPITRILRELKQVRGVH